jgi:transcriptional regulator with XRE-family HTH domain
MRLAAGLTLEELAAQAGFGKAYLSRIENGKKVPPIATLSRLADVLGTEAASLLAAPGHAVSWRGVSVVRHHEKRPTVLGGSAFGYDYFALSDVTAAHSIQPFLFSFPAAIDKLVFFQHDGEELLHVLTGTIEWQIGADKYVLQPGDTIHFDSRIPHRGHGVAGPATALVVMHSTAGSREHLG